MQLRRFRCASVGEQRVGDYNYYFRQYRSPQRSSVATEKVLVDLAPGGRNRPSARGHVGHAPGGSTRRHAAALRARDHNGSGPKRRARLRLMHALKARVVNGRYVIDEPAHLPEGAEVELQLIDGDDLDDEERARLHAAIEEGLEDADAGRVISMEQSPAEIRALRCGSK